VTERTPLTSFLWIGLFTLLWPLTHYVVAVMRFGGDFQVRASEFLALVPMGALSGGLLLYLIDIAETKQQGTLAVLGYVVASPVAFIGSLGGSLFLPPFLGATLFGGLPLAFGAVIGFFLGRYFNRPKDS
jgi:hypothetical protein